MISFAILLRWLCSFWIGDSEEDMSSLEVPLNVTTRSETPTIINKKGIPRRRTPPYGVVDLQRTAVADAVAASPSKSPTSLLTGEEEDNDESQLITMTYWINLWQAPRRHLLEKTNVHGPHPRRVVPLGKKRNHWHGIAMQALDPKKSAA